MKRLFILAFLLLFLASCRGWRSEKPPVHLNPNLDFQASIKAQENPHPIPENTIPWGMDYSISEKDTRNAVYPQNDKEFYTGKDSNGNWLATIPIDVSHSLLDRGEERYNIYCSACHSKDGSGNGIVMNYGWFKPKPYWDQAIVSYSDGQLFDIITNGIRTMPSYSHQIPEEDRWAIVSYVRALQVSNALPYQDMPEQFKRQIRK